MTWLGAWLLSVSGFAALSLSQSKHQRSVVGRTLSAERTRGYRWLGSVLIMAAAIWTMLAFNWDVGLVALCGVATAAVFVVIAMLTFRPDGVRYLCWLPGSD